MVPRRPSLVPRLAQSILEAALRWMEVLVGVAGFSEKVGRGPGAPSQASPTSRESHCPEEEREKELYVQKRPL